MGFHSYDTLPYQPQLNLSAGLILDTLNWTLLTGNYTAAGSENYLIIGNFNSDGRTNWHELIPGGGIAYWYIDDVTLTPCSGTGMEIENDYADKNIYPNPFSDKLSFKMVNNESSKITLYDIRAGIIMQQEFTDTVTLNTEQLAKGIYFYEVKYKYGVIKKGKVVKD